MGMVGTELVCPRYSGLWFLGVAGVAGVAVVVSVVLHRVLLDIVVVDNDVKPGTVLLILSDLGKVQRSQLREHANYGGPVR